MRQDINRIEAEIKAIWPGHRATQLVDLPVLATLCGIARVTAKLENERPLGNFKSLGGMYAGLWALARAAGLADVTELLAEPVPGLPTLICASDGNHGLSVAAAAHRAGASARIFLHNNVPKARADRIEAFGAEVVWIEGTYDDAVDAAAACTGEGIVLIPDTTNKASDPIVDKVMEGYAVMAAEIVAQVGAGPGSAPTHLFVQAGVGGLAAAMADGLGSLLIGPGKIVVVEPANAPCVQRALELGRPERVEGNLETSAEMLSCGVASAPALATLLEHDVSSVLVSEAELDHAREVLASAGGPNSSASGAAGLAGVIVSIQDQATKDRLRLDAHSHVLILVTEGAV